MRVHPKPIHPRARRDARYRKYPEPDFRWGGVALMGIELAVIRANRDALLGQYQDQRRSSFSRILHAAET
jgi:hypothetical protein